MTAEQYIQKLRHPAKKAYATEFLAWLRNGEQGHNGPEYPGLTYMGAQAVRMNLYDLEGK